MAAKFDFVCRVIAVSDALVVVPSVWRVPGASLGADQRRHTHDDDPVLVCQQLY